MLVRSDEDREINHHGRPVEVGEEDTRPCSSSDKVEREIYLSFSFLVFIASGLLSETITGGSFF